MEQKIDGDITFKTLFESFGPHNVGSPLLEQETDRGRGTAGSCREGRGANSADTQTFNTRNTRIWKKHTKQNKESTDGKSNKREFVLKPTSRPRGRREIRWRRNFQRQKSNFAIKAGLLLLRHNQQSFYQITLEISHKKLGGIVKVLGPASFIIMYTVFLVQSLRNILIKFCNILMMEKQVWR